MHKGRICLLLHFSLSRVFFSWANILFPQGYFLPFFCSFVLDFNLHKEVETRLRDGERIWYELGKGLKRQSNIWGHEPTGFHIAPLWGWWVHVWAQRPLWSPAICHTNSMETGLRRKPLVLSIATALRADLPCVVLTFTKEISDSESNKTFRLWLFFIFSFWTMLFLDVYWSISYKYWILRSSRKSPPRKIFLEIVFSQFFSSFYSQKKYCFPSARQWSKMEDAEVNDCKVAVKYSLRKYLHVRRIY